MTKMRIDKLLANMNLGSRSEIKKYAKQGRITVNSIVEKNTARIIEPDKDVVALDEQIVRYQKYIYLMLNKPQEVVSATEDNMHRTVIDLLSEEHKAYSPFPVGRLDKDTEGLLLITNDGQFSHSLMSPKKHVNKKYFVEVSGSISESDVKKFYDGIVLDDGYKTKPATLMPQEYFENKDTSTCTVIIQEGKYHQIKRMFADIGKKVLFLKRVEIGNLSLDESLKPGEYRELTEQEYQNLLQLQGENE